MKYISTRGGGSPRPFLDILLEGLAPDGGLYLPQTYPSIDAATLKAWSQLSYQDLAVAIFALYVDDIPAEDLRHLCAATYHRDHFGSDAIAPLRPLEDGFALMGLSHGPTLAFKDLAMQFLGNAFAYALARDGRELNILGATSGDTGSAAQYAMRGKPRIRVFMLSPFGKMSAFQTAQMYSLQDANIHNLAVQGVFDDCQDIVKAVSEDLAFKKQWSIGTVNSINWSRLLAQVVYYFYGYFRACQRVGEPVDFAVPTGNFGNICAGHIAKQMGLPVGRLLLVTNENDVLAECLQTGVYRPRSREQTVATSSPSMDISKASNFERLVFDLLGRDTERCRQWFGQTLNQQGQIQFSPAEQSRLEQFGFDAGRCDHSQRLAAIRDAHQRYREVLDPHTACAYFVAKDKRRAGVPMVVMETALAAKFSDTIIEAIGQPPPRPASHEGIEQLPQRFSVVPAEVEAVKQFISENA